MRKSTFSETQIIAILDGALTGVAVANRLRKHAVSKATLFEWRSSAGRLVVRREAVAGTRGAEREAEADVHRLGG